MSNRVFNFSAGPATLPLDVLKKVQEEMLSYDGKGMSLMEMSHRSKEFEQVIHEAEALCKELLNISDDYRVLFLQGGASTQFSMVPLNFLTEDKTADYIVTGSFANKAYKEAVKLGNVNVAGNTKEANHNYIPSQDELTLSEDATYVHITSNNTIFGTQWNEYPDTGDVPLVADMSSDIMSKPMDVSKFGLIYAGAQKNLGPSGVTLVIIRKDLLEKVPETLPSMSRYDLMAESDSMYNTPPTFAVYILKLVLEWLKARGGLDAVNQFNLEKAKFIYDAIDNSDGFYQGHAQKEHRSLMNATFRLADSELESTFIKEAAENNLVGLKGHRSVGGIRASIYNAMSKEGCIALAKFMEDFKAKHSK
ncbi:phosphoserine aminotransferase [Desulfitispora alkaliphila]|uniref:3-phosphoserine/phosphohydroxythreonine transaminase n=1 Tax=Desulfitispora alkaliphila TaxID=622674 RepID=UPI003D1BB86D